MVGLVMTGPNVAGNRVYGSRVGIADDEGVDDGNSTHGVLMERGAHDNIVGDAPDLGLIGGGGVDAPGNCISANQLAGVAILGAGTDNNSVDGNKIGTCLLYTSRCV